MAAKRPLGKRSAAKAKPANASPDMVPVVIRRGTRFRGALLLVDTPAQVTPATADRLRAFGTLVEA